MRYRRNHPLNSRWQLANCTDVDSGRDSALLNIADGLIGQMLRVHVLCTLNQGMEQLDPAILRPGRLRGYRYIGPLSRANAEKLAAKHQRPFVMDKTRDQYTLAEIFQEKVYEHKPTKVMGFQRATNSPS